MESKLILPVRGATDAATFRAQPGGFSPLRTRKNFRGRNPKTERLSGGRRPGMTRLLQRPLKEGWPVQGLIPTTLADTQTGYVHGVCRDMGTAMSVPSGPLYGNLAALDAVPSMDWLVNVDVVPAGGPSANAVQACAWDPDGEFLAVASNYTVGGVNRFSVAKVDPTTGDVLWITNYADGSHNASVNAVKVTKLYTFVAIANDHTPGGNLILGYRNDTGALAIQGDLGGWAKEAVALAVYTDGTGQEWLYVAFHGSAIAGTYTGGVGTGVIRAGRWALHFRSGIVKYRVDGSAYGGAGITRTDWGTGLSASDAYYETNHRTWRFSEHNFISGGFDARPHGCEFTALACGSDGSVYFAKRNASWGPNPDRPEFLPDGSYEAYATVGKISATGNLIWLSDSDSILENEDPDYPYFNDLSFQGDPTPDPSISAICVGTDGTLFAAGRRTANSLSAFAFDSDDGVRLWDANVMGSTGTVREGAAAIDSDGNPWFAGDRNTAWDGASGAQAHLWKLSKDTGEVLNTFDVEQAVSGLCVACNGAGGVFYGLDHLG